MWPWADLQPRPQVMRIPVRLRAGRPSQSGLRPASSLREGAFLRHPGFWEEIGMSLPYKNVLIPKAKELRKNATKQENHLWYDYLRTYPVRFQRQKVISGFIADFYCHQAKLVIELDGSQHYTQDGRLYDKERSMVFARFGIQVLRFSNAEIDRQFPAVCEVIHRETQKRMLK